MALSKFGQRLSQPSPIVELMEDLGEALHNNPDILFLGGGNPAAVPEAQQLFRKHIKDLLNDGGQLETLLGTYQSPQGNEQLLQELANYLSQHCDWPITQHHIAVLNGSQNALFILLNLFAGEMADGSHRKIALPLVPEYLGYRSQGLGDDHFQVFRPKLNLTATHRFKYSVDFNRFEMADNIGAACISLPTNPSANLLAEDEVQRLLRMCCSQNKPLIVDFAYGNPFPGVVYQKQNCPWQDGMIAVMSMSKLGLPGLRTAFVVADPEVIATIVKANTIINLANGNLGPLLMSRLLASGDLKKLTHFVLPNFYEQQRNTLVHYIDRYLAPFPYRIHETGGAFFVWLWLENLPISSVELYQRLKKKNLLVMSGEPFFFGLEDNWDHAHQCLRLTYCQSSDVLEQAVKILADELSILYASTR